MDYLCRIDQFGCAIETGVLGEPEMARLREAADGLLAVSGKQPAGIRGLLSSAPEFENLEQHAAVRRLVDPVLGAGAFVARSILFDKRPEANWDVVWHQDKTIAVREKVEVAAFGPWSVKSGVPHVQPPVEVLARMLTVRLHLDECGPENGPLLVVRGSHRGLLSEAEVRATDWNRHPELAEIGVPAGSAVVMRPLILHSSRKAASPRRRRVIHLEFAADQLPGGLVWARL